MKPRLGGAGKASFPRLRTARLPELDAAARMRAPLPRAESQQWDSATCKGRDRGRRELGGSYAAGGGATPPPRWVLLVSLAGSRVTLRRRGALSSVAGPVRRGEWGGRLLAGRCSPWRDRLS